MHSNGALDADRLFERLAVGGGCMNLVHDVHSFSHTPKGGETLAIRISFATEVQFGLIAHADKGVIRRRVGAQSTHLLDHGNRTRMGGNRQVRSCLLGHRMLR